MAPMTVVMRRRRSRLAAWSAWLASLSVPVLIMAAVGHRSRLMDATATYSVIALGFVISGVAVVVAVAALASIWREGRAGAFAAARGLVVGLGILAIPVIGAWRVVVYPPLTDIATDPRSPLLFAAAPADRTTADAPVRNPSEAEIALQASAYPDIVPRHYPVGASRVYDEAKAIVDRHAWTVLTAQPPSEIDQTGRIEAVATTLLFGFRQDIVIAVVPDGDGALVRMRSAARNGAHDLGANAERIRRFFADLDDALHGISGE